MIFITNHSWSDDDRSTKEVRSAHVLAGTVQSNPIHPRRPGGHAMTEEVDVPTLLRPRFVDAVTALGHYELAALADDPANCYEAIIEALNQMSPTVDEDRLIRVTFRGLIPNHHSVVDYLLQVRTLNLTDDLGDLAESYAQRHDLAPKMEDRLVGPIATARSIRLLDRQMEGRRELHELMLKEVRARGVLGQANALGQMGVYLVARLVNVVAARSGAPGELERALHRTLSETAYLLLLSAMLYGKDDYDLAPLLAIWGTGHVPLGDDGRSFFVAAVSREI